MSRILPRYNRVELALEDKRKIDRILRESAAFYDENSATYDESIGPNNPRRMSAPTAPGDRRKLRGIPVAGGASGTSPGTDPWYALARKDRAA